MSARHSTKLSAPEVSKNLAGLHFHLDCYVARGGTTPSPFEGWATFTQIFHRRPDGYRFAVAQALLLVDEGRIVNRPDDTWICWDLLTDDLVRGKTLQSGGYIPAPAPLWTAPTADALVMKGFALIDKEYDHVR